MAHRGPTVCWGGMRRADTCQVTFSSRDGADLRGCEIRMEKNTYIFSHYISQKELLVCLECR